MMMQSPPDLSPLSQDARLIPPTTDPTSTSASLHDLAAANDAATLEHRFAFAATNTTSSTCPDALSRHGRTPLMAAAHAGAHAAARVLLANGADPLLRDGTYGTTSLMLAAAGGHLAIVADLLLRLEGTSTTNAVDATDAEGRAALLYAARRGHGPVVGALVEAGAAVDARDECGLTALSAASSAGHADVVAALLRAGADPAATDESGATALHLACFRGRADVVRVLLLGHHSSGGVGGDGDFPFRSFDLDMEDGFGDTARELAAEGGHVGIVEMMESAARGGGGEQKQEGGGAEAAAAGADGRECFGYLVPDREAQKALAALGFDPTAYQPSSGKRYGGAHVSVLQRRTYVKDACRGELAAAAAALQALQGWVLPRLEIKNDRQVVFHCPMLADASQAGMAAGWPKVETDDDWHVYFYLGGAGADAQKAAALRNCLQQARWGWVLSVSTAAAGKTFTFDWDSFIPIAVTASTVANVAVNVAFGAGAAHLHAVNSAGALDGSGKRRDVATWRGAPGAEHDGADRWQFQPPADDGSVRIVNVRLGEPLYAVGGSGDDPKRRDVRCWAGSSSTDHGGKDRWIVALQRDGTYTITNFLFKEALYTVFSDTAADPNRLRVATWRPGAGDGTDHRGKDRWTTGEGGEGDTKGE